MLIRILSARPQDHCDINFTFCPFHQSPPSSLAVNGPEICNCVFLTLNKSRIRHECEVEVVGWLQIHFSQDKK